MKKLILIRHGATDYTEKGLYCGQKDIPLNNKGKREASRLREDLKQTKIDRVYSSDLKRAYETAEIIFKNRTIHKRRSLREIDFGSAAGFRAEEIKRVFPDIYNFWMNNPAAMKFPKGESVSHFSRRVLRCFRSIARQNKKKSVAIVTHGGPIRIILLYLLGLSLDKFWKIEQKTAALNIIESRNGRWVILPS